MPQPFPQVFTPLQLRHKTLRNRIVFGAHTANMAEQGLPGARHLGYYPRRPGRPVRGCISCNQMCWDRRSRDYGGGWPMVGYWIQRTAGDGQLRARLYQLGARWDDRIRRQHVAR